MRESDSEEQRGNENVIAIVPGFYFRYSVCWSGYFFMLFAYACLLIQFLRILLKAGESTFLFLFCLNNASAFIISMHF